VSDKRRGDLSPLTFFLVAYAFERFHYPEFENFPLSETDLENYIKIINAFISHTEGRLCDCGTCINYRTQLYKIWKKIF